MTRFAIAALVIAGLVSIAPAAVDAAPRKEARPLRVEVYKKYRGGYSVRKADTIETRRFTDPSLGPNAQAGPFDNGFFFETPRGPYGGRSPYLQ
jgi:hypothetical protein